MNREKFDLHRLEFLLLNLILAVVPPLLALIFHSLALPAFLPVLTEISQRENKLWVGHNIKFDSHFLGRYGFRPERMADTMIAQWLVDENTRVLAMRDRLERELMDLIPYARINGGGAERLPNTVSIAFEYVEGEAILLLLSEKGICASSGSACTSGSLEPSHVLRAMGVPFTCAHGSIRFSLSRFTTDEEIDTVIRELPPIIRRLREISPFGRELLNK